MVRQCRFCGEALTHSFVDLGASPLANSNLESHQLDGAESFYPLHPYVCQKCFLVQLDEVEIPSNIFSNYAYLSSFSDSWVRHARDYVAMIVERLKLDRQHNVVEIASNDGYLLQFFVQRGIPALGVEPAANIAEVAIGKGIPTTVKFFGTQTARELLAEGKPADLIIGNNVLAHVPDLNDFVSGLQLLLSRNGVITIEVPHLLRLIEEHQFDTIYHEHFSYFSLYTLREVFARHRLTIFDVQELPTHGGSLRIFVRHVDDESRAETPAVAALIGREQAGGLTSLETYLSFTGSVKETKRELLRFLIDAKQKGKTIVGYGAPAKGNTLLNYCGIRSDFIDYVVDRSPYKQGRFLPGTRIAIHDPARIRETRPDYLLLLPWNLREEIMEQMAFVREWGCKFVTPIPKVDVHP